MGLTFKTKLIKVQIGDFLFTQKYSSNNITTFFIQNKIHNKKTWRHPPYRNHCTVHNKQPSSSKKYFVSPAPRDLYVLKFIQIKSIKSKQNKSQCEHHQKINKIVSVLSRLIIFKLYKKKPRLPVSLVLFLRHTVM